MRKRKENQKRAQNEKSSAEALESELAELEKKQEELAATEDFDGAHEISVKAEKVHASMRESR